MNWSTATAATRRTSPGSRPFSARNLRIHILGPGGRRATLSATSTPSSTRRLTSSTPSRRILKCIPISWMARGASRCWNRSWHRRNRRGGRKSLQSGKQMKTIKAGIIGTGFIGPAHVEAARRGGGVEMAALFGANGELARAQDHKIKQPKTYGRAKNVPADQEKYAGHKITPK